ncbi:Ig-like domain-containing protein [Aquimarina spongiae]|uniref:Uncharacterized protein n=1 Tax=Aquimarina spongiae TaxID=570521 RepID=A0A1M6KV96_9FLAO|nr:Ig-like domain-containing protein [Aquimarina spongiae]SHJ62782.1 hypothetical protein SAMN04488508_11280 [Aquimarina spongiae]
MRIRIRHIILMGFSLLFSISFALLVQVEKPVQVTLKTTQKKYQAGDKIMLDFAYDSTLTFQLFLKNSYGSTLLTSSSGQFIIPEYLAKKRGTLDYFLIHNSKCVFKGDISIHANSDTLVELETYIGPPSIVAGDRDYTMHVVAPTDRYDNPLPDSTKVKFKHQFLGAEKEYEELTKDLIGWRNIFAYEKKGKLLVSSQIGETDSKEFSVEIYPALPEDFAIESFREHNYADGNQIITFSTGIVRDEFDNIVANGTMVNFVIKNQEGTLLKAQGTTVNGIALGKVLHPSYEDVWQVQAFVNGIAKSNTISVVFEAVLEDFEVDFDTSNREIVVGPLRSFMEQIIPDGALVKLEIYKDNKRIETKVKTSFEGEVRFILAEGFYPTGDYDFDISSLGVTKTFKNITLQ